MLKIQVGSFAVAELRHEAQTEKNQVTHKCRRPTHRRRSFKHARGIFSSLNQTCARHGLV